MISDLTLRLASRADAPAIARLSRDRIEQGLGWSWTAPRVLRSILDAQTNVVVAREAARLLGFGIMKYHDDDAHLLLLAVRASSCRRGVGAALVAWLERSASVAGIGQVVLEARISNEAARAFYRHLGYREMQTVPGYYAGREAGVRLAKDLRLGRPEPP
ncbi:MAG TPA: GNAT family N-acetyltransferase [Burkholderiaceae bacterium]